MLLFGCLLQPCEGLLLFPLSLVVLLDTPAGAKCAAALALVKFLGLSSGVLRALAYTLLLLYGLCLCQIVFTELWPLFLML